MLFSGKYVVTVCLIAVLTSSCLGYFVHENFSSDNVDLVLIEKEKVAAYELGFFDGNSTGFYDGLVSGAGSGFNIRDPSYSEMLSFVESDKTQFHKYNVVSYNCFHFCSDFLNNAFEAGFKAGFVYVEFQDGAHGLVCFDTVDKGLVFVEPQSDEVVALKVGYSYDLVEDPNVVLAYTIIW